METHQDQSLVITGSPRWLCMVAVLSHGRLSSTQCWALPWWALRIQAFLHGEVNELQLPVSSLTLEEVFMSS